MDFEQQALHLAPPGLLLRLNLVERKLQGGTGRQPSFQRSEFQGGGRGEDGGRRRLSLEARQWRG
jgi:hypothetical protein